MSEGFLFDGDNKSKWHNLELFWRVVRLYKIEGEKPRIELLRKIVSRKQAKYIRDPQEFIKNRNIKKIGFRPDIKGDTNE
jgi:hypothetical protein